MGQRKHTSNAMQFLWTSPPRGSVQKHEKLHLGVPPFDFPDARAPGWRCLAQLLTYTDPTRHLRARLKTCVGAWCERWQQQLIVYRQRPDHTAPVGGLELRANFVIKRVGSKRKGGLKPTDRTNIIIRHPPQQHVRQWRW